MRDEGIQKGGEYVEGLGERRSNEINYLLTLIMKINSLSKLIYDTILSRSSRIFGYYFIS